MSGARNVVSAHEPATQRAEGPDLLRFTGSVNHRCGEADRGAHSKQAVSYDRAIASRNRCVRLVTPSARSSIEHYGARVALPIRRSVLHTRSPRARLPHTDETIGVLNIAFSGERTPRFMSITGMSNSKPTTSCGGSPDTGPARVTRGANRPLARRDRRGRCERTSGSTSIDTMIGELARHLGNRTTVGQSRIRRGAWKKRPQYHCHPTLTAALM